MTIDKTFKLTYRILLQVSVGVTKSSQIVVMHRGLFPDNVSVYYLVLLKPRMWKIQIGLGPQVAWKPAKKHSQKSSLLSGRRKFPQICVLRPCCEHGNDGEKAETESAPGKRE